MKTKYPRSVENFQKYNKYLIGISLKKKEQSSHENCLLYLEILKVWIFIFSDRKSSINVTVRAHITYKIKNKKQGIVKTN